MMSKDIWSAADYSKNAPFVYSQAFASPVLELLDAKPGERILDLGCGTGELDVDIAKAVGENGLVLATDASENMISKARSSWGQIPNIEFRLEDAAHLPSHLGPSSIEKQAPAGQPQFDAVFTNAALHWILKQAPSKLAFFQSVHALLTPQLGTEQVAERQQLEGGRFVAEFGGYLNVVGVRSAIWRALRSRGYDAEVMDPWYFPGVEECTKLLENAGFSVNYIALVPRITPLPSGLVPWLRTFFLGNFLKVIPPQRREENPEAYAAKERAAEEVMLEIERDCEIDCKDPFTGKWSLMYVRMRFVAVAKV